MIVSEFESIYRSLCRNRVAEPLLMREQMPSGSGSYWKSDFRRRFALKLKERVADAVSLSVTEHQYIVTQFLTAIWRRRSFLR